MATATTTKRATVRKVPAKKVVAKKPRARTAKKVESNSGSWFVWLVIFGIALLFLKGCGKSDVEKQPNKPVETIKQVVLEKGWGWSNPSDMFLQLHDVKIKNNTNKDIKDPEIYCSASGESGTRIDSNSREQFKIIKAGETITLGDVDMGFLHSQASKVGCTIRTFKTI